MSRLFVIVPFIAAGLYVFAYVDLVLTESEAVIIEVNPRLTTAYLGVRSAVKGNAGVAGNVAALALAPLTQRICYLEEGDWVVVTRDGSQIYDVDDNPVYLAPNKYNLQLAIERWPQVGFHDTREHGQILVH